jgi:hypothetical protein
MERFRGVVNSRLSFNQNLDVVISGDFMYVTEEEIDCFDKDGNFLMKHKKEVFTNRENSDLIKNCFSIGKICKSVFQKDFDFRLIETFYYSKHEDLIKYPWASINCFIESIPENENNPRFRYLDRQYAKTNEICLSGTQRYSVFHNLGKKIINFSYSEYKKNLDKFIKENESHKDEAMYIFNKNLEMFANYFMCETEELKSEKFDIKKQFMKKLNFKINQKCK